MSLLRRKSAHLEPPASTLRQRALAAGLRQQQAEDDWWRVDPLDPDDWSLEAMRINGAATPETVDERDPWTGERVTRAEPPGPWFPLGRQDPNIHR